MRIPVLALLVGTSPLAACAAPPAPVVSVPEAPAPVQAERPRCPIGMDSILRIGEPAMTLTDWQSMITRQPEEVRTPSQRMLWGEQAYVWFGRPREIAGGTSPGVTVHKIGEYRGLPVFAEPNPPHPGPQVIYLPAPCGCALQPFQRMQCTAERRPGIEVRVLDARTDRPPARGATLVVRDGAFADTATQTAPLPERGGGVGEVILRTARERAGTYALEVRAPGYRPWRAGGVAVHQGVCHVETVELTVYLDPLRE
jgi:hypothetical protein